MGEARHNILTKFSQQQRMNRSFQGKQMLDAVNLIHFSEPLVQDSWLLLKR
ncbi:hypothetical protein KY349_04370 [Candidatus Woesearchaeota archaeon]|nr:hypothetical protein [Candidatus Woesearchaeota archaeon]